MKINKLRMLASDKGFTLIELMIVIAIIGILAAIAIPNFIAYRDKAFCSSAEADAGSIAAGIADYFAIPSHTSLLKAATGSIDKNGVATSMATGLKFSKLTGENTATVGGGLAAIRITVLESANRCPKSYMDANPAEWTEVGGKKYFTKQMK